ncbi:hypothetical protein HY623_04075 [Candidatus Uhrbacteria bacterium]|nr:hypothetical protein [Candidatus Uhrbacteria bacterium]
MKRTQLQLEEELYTTLRERAFQEHSSVASVIRTMLREQMRPSIVCRTPKHTIKDFSFIGAGASRGKGAGTISKRHDEELIKVYDVC